jgi:hypothetical protein
MFKGPLDAYISWNDDGLEENRKFLDEIFRLLMGCSIRYTMKWLRKQQKFLRINILIQFFAFDDFCEYCKQIRKIIFEVYIWLCLTFRIYYSSSRRRIMGIRRYFVP